MSTIKKITSYPFEDKTASQIKSVSDRIGIVYCPNNEVRVYFDDTIVDDCNYRGLLCYFKFLDEQRRKYVKKFLSDDTNYKVPHVNIHLDIVIMYFNEIISFCKEKSLSPDPIDFLYRLNDSTNNYRYLDCIIDTLMCNSSNRNSDDDFVDLSLYVDSIIAGDLFDQQRRNPSVKCLSFKR